MTYRILRAPMPGEILAYQDRTLVLGFPAMTRIDEPGTAPVLVVVDGRGRPKAFTW